MFTNTKAIKIKVMTRIYFFISTTVLGEIQKYNKTQAKIYEPNLQPWRSNSESCGTKK